MSPCIDALWLNVSPALKVFDRPLLQNLAQSTAIAQWEYLHGPDEPASLDQALSLLHDYLKNCDRPIHILGHGTGGLLGLLYAQQHPERVRSLTILSVGIDPAIDWQSCYYAHRRTGLTDQQTLLRQLGQHLLGCSSKAISQTVIHSLEQDLYQSLSPHNLLQSISLLPISVEVPLLVCGSADDAVIPQDQFQAWRQYLHHSLSRLWICLSGRYFFHCFHPDQVGQQITQFWNRIPSLAA